MSKQQLKAISGVKPQSAEKDLRALVAKASKVVFKGYEGDAAAKVYFYPLCAALLSQEEFERVTEDDDINVKAASVGGVIKKLAERLDVVAQEIFKEVSPDHEVYMTIVVYGMVSKGVAPVFILFEVSKGNPVEVRKVY